MTGPLREGESSKKKKGHTLRYTDNVSQCLVALKEKKNKTGSQISCLASDT